MQFRCRGVLVVVSDVLAFQACRHACSGVGGYCLSSGLPGFVASVGCEGGSGSGSGMGRLSSLLLTLE